LNLFLRRSDNHSDAPTTEAEIDVIMRANLRRVELWVLLFCMLSSQNVLGFMTPSPIARHQQRTGRSCPPLAIAKPRTASFHRLNVLATRNAGNNDHKRLTLRDRLRQVTGFSFTAFRATLRGITGISLTALYASAVASTSLFVRNTMKIILSVFPTWVRSTVVVVF